MWVKRSQRTGAVCLFSPPIGCQLNVDIQHHHGNRTAYPGRYASDHQRIFLPHRHLLSRGDCQREPGERGSPRWLPLLRDHCKLYVFITLGIIMHKIHNYRNTIF